MRWSGWVLLLAGVWLGSGCSTPPHPSAATPAGRGGAETRTVPDTTTRPAVSDTSSDPGGSPGPESSTAANSPADPSSGRAGSTAAGSPAGTGTGRAGKTAPRPDPFHLETPSAPQRALVLAAGEAATSSELTYGPEVPEIFVSLDVKDRQAGATLNSIWTGPDGTTMSDSCSLGKHPGRVSFSALRPASGWKSGRWTVEVREGDQVLASQAFTIEAGAAATPEALDYIVLNRDPDAETSLDRIPAESEAVYLVVGSSRLAPQTPLSANWSVEQVEGHAEGELVSQSSVKTEGPDHDSLFTLTPPPGHQFTPGRYRVELFEGRKPLWHTSFTIEAARP